MKELSIEEKAKAYDEAIERASKLRVQNPFDTVSQMMEHVFPEFKESKESDGEKIRKHLIIFFKDEYGENSNARFAGIKVKDIIALLEKQGEQKVNEIYPIFRVGDHIRNKKTNDKVLIKQLDVKSKTYYYTSYDGAAEFNSDFSFYDQDKWELIGQKIIEQKSAVWSEEDENEYNHILKILNLVAEEQETKGYNNLISSVNWLKSLRPQNTWKPSDLPHWKKSTLPDDDTTGFNSDYFCYKGYNINYKELFEKLPKDD